MSQQPENQRTAESRFVVRSVDDHASDADHVQRGEADDGEPHFETFADVELPFRSRANTAASQITQSDLSRMGIISSLGDAGSLLGSSLLLSSPSYLNIGHEISKIQAAASDGIQATSMEYLETIMENAEYIDTIKGRLPLAEAARMIAKEKSNHEELFDKSHVRQVHVDCYKRLVCIGLSFLCLFSSFFSLRNLQSSVGGSDPAVGFATFGCLSMLSWFGCLASNSLIYYARPKWTMVVAGVGFLLYPLANFFPVAYVLIPCAILCSFAQGLLWSSEGVYMINLAAKYAMITKKPLIEVIGKFNGVIFTMQQSAHIVGNVISSVLLNENIVIFAPLPSLLNDSAAQSGHEGNGTALTNASAACGLAGLSSERSGGGRFSNLDPRQLKLLYGILITLTFVGVMSLALLLRPLKMARIAGSSNLCKNLLRLARLFKNPRIWLLVPFMSYPGYSASIAVADYTKAYITCGYGVGYIGYVLLTGAFFSVTGAFVSGRLVHITGRLPLFLFASLSTSSCYLVMLFWKTDGGERISVMAFLPVCFWCLGDGIIVSQLNGLLGEIFRTDLAYALSTLHLFYGLGTVFGTLSTALKLLTLANKIYLGLAHIWLALSLLVVLEVIVRKKKDK